LSTLLKEYFICIILDLSFPLLTSLYLSCHVVIVTAINLSMQITDEVTGDVRSITVERTVRPMWFTSSNGKKVLQLRYGSKVIELMKGKNAIEFNDDQSLIEVLQTVRGAIEGGELDVQIGTASDVVKNRFKK
jgi:hypothetical protein